MAKPDTGRRLTDAGRARLVELIRAGATHEEAAASVGCTANTVQRLMQTTGGLAPRTRPRSPLRLSLSEREGGDLSGTGGGSVASCDCPSPLWEGSIYGLAGGSAGRWEGCLSGLAGRRRSREGLQASEAVEAGPVREVAP